MPDRDKAFYLFWFLVWERSPLLNNAISMSNLEKELIKCNKNYTNLKQTNPCYVVWSGTERWFVGCGGWTRSIVPIGAYLLSAKVVGELYDREVTSYHRRFPNRQWNAEEMNTCYGWRCFGYSLTILASVSVMAVLVALVLAWRTKSVYLKPKPNAPEIGHWRKLVLDESSYIHIYALMIIKI